ncbi:MAG: hypothetical protein EOM18_02865 [Clostridia bacterium]|nr:hypothetical protein [Clostridia bacterium]
MEEEKGTNEELVANQQIVIPPQIEDDFRFSKIDKVYAFAKEECSVLEEMNDSARITGTLPKDGVCYIIQEESNGWLYVESGRVRGFLKSEQLITGEEAEQIRKTAKEEAEANGEKVKFEKAKVELAPLENKSLLRTMTSAQKVVVDKVYGIASGNMVNIRDGKSTDANIVGTISEGQICYLLADKTKEWIFVESGDVRGFIKSEYLMTGDEADSKIKEITDAGQDPEQVCGLANQIVDPKANAACYYTLTSTKAASKMNQVRKALIAYAAQFVGNPYVWGGTDPVNGADCSGFVQTIYGQFGIGLPRTSAAQSQFGLKIPVSDAAPGDLIFYANNGQVYHVVIYIGEGKTIEAASTKSGIVCRGVNYGNAVWATRVIND